MTAPFKPRQSFAKLRDLIRGGGAHLPFEQRITATAPPSSAGEYVLYWIQAARRIEENLALDYAISLANERDLPVVVFEALRPDYPEANARIHTFVLQSVAEQYDAAARRGVRYLFFLPRTPAEAKGVVQRLAERASVVVTDDYPTGIVREQTARFLERSTVPVHLVDSNGILPMRAFGKEEYSARFLRDKAHRMFDQLWSEPPNLKPKRPPFDGDLRLPHYGGADPQMATRQCAIDQAIVPARSIGGRSEALRRLDRFVSERLDGYAGTRSREADRSSELSAYLHFGFVSIHEIARRALLSAAPIEDIDAFLEESIIRRELSFNFCFYRSDHTSLTALPDWAKTTLDAHRADRRKPQYSYEALEGGATHDEVWNLAQRGLREQGTIHNYLRMLWGKKIIEWSASPEEAHATMIRLHARYALDGRDPNTHAGILWCFGKHDRAWAPERPIFGSVRYMSSESTRRKVDLRAYAASIDREE